eukprot:CAMPEP_0114987712 /NCGR_PEP_ID=MMETSP0216-20121206/9170_1 /TAXON_ID=223996 /ORGANISM="Protocruzia adherens, Strain Boccale" /LENGTH=390 /DNA_ID=CAMNT_0002350361 /DNA_START=37 /DNA_END=1209 /DNA_ORIENTATION=+
MSLTVQNSTEVSHSPLNLSKSKQLFSFPRTERFKREVDHATKQAPLYSLPEVSEKRAASFGYGRKSDFTSTNRDTPAPNKYVVDSEFTPAKHKKCSYSFGASREVYDKVYLENHRVADRSVPGPGAYDWSQPLGKQSRKATLKSRNKLLASNLTVPGPGAYTLSPTLNDKGKYFVSKFKNSSASVFSPPSSKRFQRNPGANIPGPGTYGNVEFNATGSYFVSKFKSSFARTFSNSARNSWSSPNLLTPGPGSYRLPSEFGYYASKNADAFDAEMKRKELRSTQTTRTGFQSGRGTQSGFRQTARAKISTSGTSRPMRARREETDESPLARRDTEQEVEKEKPTTTTVTRTKTEDETPVSDDNKKIEEDVSPEITKNESGEDEKGAAENDE